MPPAAGSWMQFTLRVSPAAPTDPVAYKTNANRGQPRSSSMADGRRTLVNMRPPAVILPQPIATVTFTAAGSHTVPHDRPSKKSASR